MTSYITKKATKKAGKILNEHAGAVGGRVVDEWLNFDPYYEEVWVKDRHGNNTNKKKKIKRQAPLGISEEDAAVFMKAKKMSYRLDNCFNMMGFRVGWGAIIGLVPVVGDAGDGLLALSVWHTIQKANPGLWISLAMLVNIAVDLLIGLVPFLGDIADALFRCNTRNTGLLYKVLLKRGQKAHPELYPDVFPEHRLQQPNRDAHPQRSDIITQNPRLSRFYSSGPPPNYEETELDDAGSPHRHSDRAYVAEPKPAKVAKDRDSGGWFGRFGGKRERAERDVEMAEAPPRQPRRPSY